MTESVDHPAHYGGADDPYEVIKVLRAWDLELAKGFVWGNIVKYIGRAGKKEGTARALDYEKANWYSRELVSIEKELAEKKEPIPKSVVVSGETRILIDWETRTYQMQNQPISQWYGYGGGGGGGSSAPQGTTWVSPGGAASATVKRCNSTYGCVHGYHGRGCPLYKDVP